MQLSEIKTLVYTNKKPLLSVYLVKQICDLGKRRVLRSYNPTSN